MHRSLTKGSPGSDSFGHEPSVRRRVDVGAVVSQVHTAGTPPGERHEYSKFRKAMSRTEAAASVPAESITAATAHRRVTRQSYYPPAIRTLISRAPWPMRPLRDGRVHGVVREAAAQNRDDAGESHETPGRAPVSNQK